MTTFFHIDGMVCAMCVSHVEKALQSVAGVRSAQVSLQERRAEVEGDNLDLERLQDAVKKAGYEARLEE